MKTIEVMARALCQNDHWHPNFWKEKRSAALAGLLAIKEPDPHVVAAVADKLNMEPTKVAAVWMLMVERCLE